MKLVAASLSSPSCIVNKSPSTISSSSCSSCGLGNCPGNTSCTGVSALSMPPCRQNATKRFTSTTPDALQAPDAINSSSQ
eukprot:2623505-Amphidinium_carterae.1